MTAPTIIGPRPVPVGAVDKELEAMWKTLAPPAPTEATPVMQASVVNLVAVAGSSADADAAVEIMLRLMGRAPCRFMVIDSQPDADPPEMQASVSVLCEKAGDRQLCCEMIRLSARGITADALPSTAQAFYAPDLPVMVWWLAPFHHPDLVRFMASADRLVIDSLTFGPEALGRLANLIEQSRQMRTAVGDLNWVRLTPYRQLFAQFFDSSEWLQALQTIETVVIEAQESAGQLLTGWLLSRLAQAPMALTRDQVQLKVAGEGPVFRSLVMTCAGGEFAVTRTNTERVEARAVVGGETITRAARIPVATVEKLLSEEIGRSGRDRAYDAAVRAAR